MLKEKDTDTGVLEPTREMPEKVFIQLSCDDFKLNEDGSWVTTRGVEIDGPRGKQRLIPAGRTFSRGQMSIFGLDLAVVLEKQCG